MAANDTQHGGGHYRSSYQHWDWVEDIGMGYLLAACTKYLTRWKEKHRDGLLDLTKAGHYLDKFIEVSPRHAQGRLTQNMPWNIECTQSFLEANPQINRFEHDVFHKLAVWTTRSDLIKARRMIEAIIQKLKAEPEKPKKAKAKRKAKVSEAAYAS